MTVLPSFCTAVARDQPSSRSKTPAGATPSIELLRYLEPRIPHAAVPLLLVRERQERERLVLMRKLIKRFERLDVDQEMARLSAASARQGFWIAMIGSWRHQLRQLVTERAHSAMDAVVHSTGVYFPKRSHAARIAIKKFRYAVEISAYSGVLTDEPLVRTLKKTQDLLGEMHDRQTLIDELNDSGADQAGIDAGQIDRIVRLTEVEIDDRHARVLARRPEVLEACRRAQRGVRGSELPIGVLAVAGVVALGTGLEARRRHGIGSRPGTRDESTPEVSVRIPVALPTPKRVEPADVR